jgi:hypothetical protein
MEKKFMNEGKKLIRWLGVLSLVGGFTALPLMIAFAITGWGGPGTVAYRTYELLNRLMAISLLFMSAGWVGLAFKSPAGYGRWGGWLAVVGAILVITGNGAEFWLFSDLTYDCCNMRHTAWGTFLLGLLLTAAGATLSGLAFQRTHRWPRWITILLILALPLVILSFIVSPFLGPVVLALALGWVLVTSPSSKSQLQQDTSLMTAGHKKM